MHKVKKHIGIRILFLVLFLGYFADISFFTHVHIVHGVTIVHSHYSYGDHSQKNTDKTGHTHSESALTLIQHATSWVALVQSLSVTFHDTFSHFTASLTEYLYSVQQSIPDSSHLRGPPVLG